MSLHENQTNGLGEYAPPPKKGKISRGRKALIAFMALGAFAATSGAGTFASFTASTDNAGGVAGANNPFRTPDFELANTVLSRSNDVDGDPTCLSSDDAEDFPTEDFQLANVDGDNAAYCDALFVTNDFATTATANLRLENTGASDGDLVLYAVDMDDTTGGTQTCVVDTSSGGEANLCGKWELYVQEYAVGGTVLSGTTSPDFEDTGERVSGGCWVGTPTGGFCVAADGDTFSALPTLATLETIGSLPFDDSVEANDDARFFRVHAQLAPDAGCTDGDSDGFDDATGIGCHNTSSDGSARIQLRWVLIPQ